MATSDYGSSGFINPFNGPGKDFFKRQQFGDDQMANYSMARDLANNYMALAGQVEGAKQYGEEVRIAADEAQPSDFEKALNIGSQIFGFAAPFI